MYEDLISVLRECSKLGTRYGMAVIYMEKAADAIEELSRKYTEERNAAVELTGELASKPHWIPVTERLPEENDDVLIYGEWTGASGTKYREIWLTDLKGFLHQGYKPIAWMPLPEPPKEEDTPICTKASPASRGIYKAEEGE